MATLYVGVPLLAYFPGRLFSVEHSSRILLSILALGASGALALAWAESGGQLRHINFGYTELVYFIGCIASALFPVLTKWGLARGILSPSAELRTFWSLVSGAISIGLIGFLLENPLHLNRMNLIDILLLTYLAVFSSGVTFWLTQRSSAVMTPGSVTAYSYLVPFVSMLLLLVEQPQLIGWHWFPGSALVLTAIIALFYREAGKSPAALNMTIGR
jgi:drug/metabolite transporter (DMT)-like permease